MTKKIKYYSETTSHDNQVQKGIKQFIKRHQPDILSLFHDKREGIDKYISASEAHKSIVDLKLPTLIFQKIDPADHTGLNNPLINLI